MIVIPMAGSSRRFSEAGYHTPKYMLPLAGRTLFEWTILSFSEYFTTEQFTFVLREVSSSTDFVRSRCRALGLQNFSLVTLDHETAGQAETVEFGLAGASVGHHEQITIFNIDTIRPNIRIDLAKGTDGWLEVFRAAGDHWSFVEPNPHDLQLVERTSEKRRISDYCCTGLYQFASKELFEEALFVERRSPSSHELFVAPMFNHLIDRGCRIGWHEVARDEVILSGVPVEYEALKASPPSSLKAMRPTWPDQGHPG